MAVAVAVPKEYGYVLTTAAATFFVSMWHGMRIGSFRKASGIRYPQSYAEKSDMENASADKKHAMYLFNCAQRAHYNYIENHTSAVIAMLLAGVKYPVASSIMGVGWIVSRMAYALGYTRKDRSDGKGRLIGAPFWLFQIGLFGLTAWSGMEMLR